MGRQAKGPRLHFRPARPDKRLAAVWVVRDGQKETSTGCGEGGFEQAQLFLADYIAGKYKPPEQAGDQPSRPADVLVAEVIALYSAEKAPTGADPSAVKSRLEALLEWWGDKTLADIRRSSCEAYVAHRKTQPIKSFTRSKTPRLVTAQGARRELEDLSAAIGYWDAEYPLTRRPKVTLPAKPEPTRDALTRGQAARLLMAARGYRWESDRWRRLGGSAAANRRHLRRFILMGVYTGTRPGVLPKLLWSESPLQAWVDLDAGMIWRRGRSEREHATKRRPVVRLPGRLLAHMRRWKASDDRVAVSQDSGEHAATKRRVKPDQRPVTVLHHGGRPLAGRIRTGFEGVVRDAGLDGEVTPHWMRHTCVTWLMEAGVSVWDASGYTGMSPAMIEKHYGHHRPDHQAAARRALR
ncbi:hypothetical protein DDF62_22125 [Caulobacter radicis]|uniref:tyrosine-type recombinase/integrase n=1 Tax=Caulobacter radicis TaxID=2172650 RepID=UPI000D583DDB|nr:tyrosine-type recombinase/integrase [Caulobacter radicis]PVM84435.1 hypothetical protein DDF62_22125 [Caulobacter radicis]